VTKHIDAGVALRYEREHRSRVLVMKDANWINWDLNDEYIFAYDHNGHISWDFRYNFNTAARYSRLVLPPAPKFTVPIRAGVFTATVAWPFEEHIQLSRQLVLLSYGDDERTVTGLQLTVIYLM